MSPLSEAQWQRQVCDLLDLYQWKWFHDHDSRRNPAGLPDIVAVRERVIWLELKAPGGKLRASQVEWIGLLRAANQEVWVWEPKHLDLAVEVLSRRAPLRAVPAQRKDAA